ncbi:MAG TPA: hypothetical protein VK422_00435 [Pyrinomonadaceae bacterium]|nr:hypothetical protein [Pyrinomonadaceae bacterium]
MSHDQRDALEVLTAELGFIEKGGYGRSVRTPWLPTSVFKDSQTCINFGYPYRAHPCGECLLNDYVPPDRRSEVIPCHHIPLNAEGETLASLELKDNQSLTERAVKDWLRAKIRENSQEESGGGNENR